MSFLDINWSIVIQFAVFVVLLLCSALISGAEVALFSLTPAEVNTLREEKIPSSNIIAKLVDNPKKLLATVLIANNLVNISIVLLFVDLGDFLFGGITTPWVRTVLDVGVVTFVLLLCGEILPKIYANRNNIQFAQRVGYFIYVLDSVFTPISVPMKAFTVWIQKRLGKQKSNISIGQLSQALELSS